jgi:hypothetical protein
VIIALAGIWLSWTTRYVKKIAANGWLYIHLRRHPQLLDPNLGIAPPEPPSVMGDDENTTENADLLGRDADVPKKRKVQAFAKVLIENHGVRDLFWESFGEKMWDTHNTVALLVFTALVALLASGIIIGAYFLVRIIPDSPARLASDKCGLWLFDGEKRSEEATRARMLDLEKEERAAQFAEDCYGESGSFATRCKILHQPTLPMETTYTNDCPFANEICRLNRTVSFSTPLIDAKALGINSPSTPRFWRNTTCTPLSMDFPYIQNKTVNGTKTYTYHYGPKQVDGQTFDYTYSTVGDPWDRLAPVYDVFAYSSNSDGSDHPVWTPHVNLTHPPYSTVTIIFISSLRILYEEYSSDPIFPADKKFHLPGDSEAPAWHRNSDPRARPLACINTIEVCSADGATCWNVNEPSSNISISDTSPEYILLYSALYKTDIYYSLAKRQGRSLLAQKKVSQYFSSSLGDDPWVAEVESWVRTALARTSINTWSVASGEDSVHAGKGGFIEITKPYGNLCGIYKYHPRDYQSLRFIPLMLLVASLPFIWFLSLNGRKIVDRASPWLDRVDKPLLDSMMEMLGERGHSRMLTRKLLEPRFHARSAGNIDSTTQLSSHNTDGGARAASRAEGSEIEQARDLDDTIASSASTDEHELVGSREIVTRTTPNEDLASTDTSLIVYEPVMLYLLTYSFWFIVTRFLVVIVFFVGRLSKLAWGRLSAMLESSADQQPTMPDRSSQ